MRATIRAVEYFYTNVQDQPGEGHRVLSALAAEGVDLVAFGTKSERFDSNRAQEREYRALTTLVSSASGLLPLGFIGLPVWRRAYVGVVGSWRRDRMLAERAAFRHRR